MKTDIKNDPFVRKLSPMSKEEKKLQNKQLKKLRKKVKKYDTIGALWFDEENKDQVYITSSSIFYYYENLYKEKDQHSGNKYYFELMQMFKIVDLEEEIKELKKGLPLSS